ncbi:IclR family transcriptional regulator [Halorubrum trueperi]|uniref:IclR family transcriptional regulator n=1 Tax=Halorubrum trueperi TaxID=2004704 RepID=A0ABD5UHD9_9EURY
MDKVPIDAVGTSVHVLNALRERPQAVTELATRLDRPKATIYYHLKTLENFEYVVQRDGKYELGLRLLELGGSVGARHQIIDVVAPNVKRLVSEAHETGFFAVMASDAAVVIEIERPSDIAEQVDLALGTYLPLHCSATGKAILTALSDETRHEIFERITLDSYTEDTITDESALATHLEHTRSEGHVFDMGERSEHIRAVASPATTSDGYVIGALGIIGTSQRLYDDRFTHELPHLLNTYVERMKHEFQSSSSKPR